MRKILSAFLAMLTLSSFLLTVACGSGKADGDTVEKNDTTTVEPNVETPIVEPFDYVAPNVDKKAFSITLANYVTFGAQRFINTYVFEDKYYVFIPADFDISNTMLYFNLPNKCSVKLDGKSIETGFHTLDFSKGKTYDLNVNLVGVSSKYTLIGLQSSAPTMYLDIDEKLGTFEAMNSDLTKKTFAYGLCYMDSTNNSHDFVSYFDIHGHGNSTWKSPRLDKPYNLRFRDDETYSSGRKIGLIAAVVERSAQPCVVMAVVMVIAKNAQITTAIRITNNVVFRFSFFASACS